jgi:hypothetical protein
VPAVFSRHHTDIRYQLTVIGRPTAAWVIDELDARGVFTIGTQEGGVRVSWQLTCVRTDLAA